MRLCVSPSSLLALYITVLGAIGVEGGGQTPRQWTKAFLVGKTQGGFGEEALYERLERRE